jgi:hypothetical protein
MRFIRLLAILGVCATGPGCGLVGTGTSTLVGETKLALIHHQLLCRARQQADEAWAKVSGRARTAYSKDYERGFKDGFVRTVWWGPEEAPVVPPSGYWSARYRGREGEAAVADWAEGFRNGVSAALQNGASLSVKLPAPELHSDVPVPGPDTRDLPPLPAKDAGDGPGRESETLPPPRPVPPAAPPEKGFGAAKATSPAIGPRAASKRGPAPTMTTPDVPASPPTPALDTPPSTWIAVSPESGEEARPASGTSPIMPCADMEPLQAPPPVARLGRPW